MNAKNNISLSPATSNSAVVSQVACTEPQRPKSPCEIDEKMPIDKEVEEPGHTNMTGYVCKQDSKEKVRPKRKRRWPSSSDDSADIILHTKFDLKLDERFVEVTITSSESEDELIPFLL